MLLKALNLILAISNNQWTNVFNEIYRVEQSKIDGEMMIIIK